MNKWYLAAIASAILPLLAGTIVFLAWLILRQDWLMLAGYFTIMAGCVLFIAGLVFLSIAVKKFKQDGRSHGRKVLLAVFLLLVNFPIAFSFALSAEYIMTQHDVLITNNSDETINKITFTDPTDRNYVVENIQPHSEMHKFFHFHGEGNVKYKVNSAKVNASGIAFGYVTGGLGGSGSVEITSDGLVQAKEQ